MGLAGQTGGSDSGTSDLGPMGQIVPKLDKSGTFSDQISVHFGWLSQNVLSIIRRFDYFFCVLKQVFIHMCPGLIQLSKVQL